MRYSIIYMIACVFALAAISCGTTSQQKISDNGGLEEPAFRELIDLISKQPGVQVKKVGSTYDITIRSRGTFLTSHQPLFVLDGIAVGTSYQDIAEAIQVTDVDRIKVLKGSEATSYGSRGGNGVIEIWRKKGI